LIIFRETFIYFLLMFFAFFFPTTTQPLFVSRATVLVPGLGPLSADYGETPEHTAQQ